MDKLLQKLSIFMLDWHIPELYKEFQFFCTHICFQDGAHAHSTIFAAYIILRSIYFFVNICSFSFAFFPYISQHISWLLLAFAFQVSKNYSMDYQVLAPPFCCWFSDDFANIKMVFFK